MGLVLGKTFNRNYNLRLPILDGFYNIEIFFSTKSPFLLFGIEPDFSNSKEMKHNIKVNMFKNIESSQFCNTFVNLHNYKSSSLDIINQFKEIKPEYSSDITSILDENIIISKIITNDSVFYDQLIIYGFTISSFSSEFIFILTERQNIIKKLKRKMVRTSAIQLATTQSLDIISDYHKQSQDSKKIYEIDLNTEEVIKLS